MRTRVITANTTLAAGSEERLRLTNPLAGTTETITRNPFTYQSRNETIVDEEPFKRRSGNCKHSKVYTWYADSNSMKFTPWGSSPAYESVVRGSMLYHYVVLERCTANCRNLAPTITLRSFDWANASYHALEQMRPTVGDGLDTLNLLRELSEMGSTMRRDAGRRITRAERERERRLRHNLKVEKANKNANYKRKWEKSLLQSLAPESSIWKRTARFFSRAAKTVAWANLAWQFAVRPTISDAKKIASLLENFRSMVTELIRKSEKRQIRHYKRPVDNLFDLPSSVSENHVVLFGTGSSNNSTIRKTEYLFRPKYHASMLFTYDASKLKGLLGSVSGLISALGANRVASIIWEAIPFSFIVDWFVNVGDMIATYEDQVIDLLPVVIHDFSHSLKYGYRTKLQWTWNNKIVTDLAYRDTVVYERRRDYPSLTDSLSVHLPNLNQTGLGLSLLIVNMDGITNWKRR